MASSLGVQLVAVQVEFGALVMKQQPAIIHLTNPDHFTVLLDGWEHGVRLLEGADAPVMFLSRDEVEKRFDGFALIHQDDESRVLPQIRFEETDHSFGIVGIGQRVEHAFRFTNMGKKDLVVSTTGST